jgi:CheY-like chemotaxis protein
MGGVGRSVLIVDDDPSIREVMIEILTGEGYTVSEACNGREALMRLREAGYHPSLILLDLMMPVMDGFQFRGEQLRDADLAGIPVVVLSADGQTYQKAAALNVNAALRKPVELDQLLQVVAEICEKCPAGGGPPAPP